MRLGLLLFLLATPALAADPWDKTDVALAAGAGVAQALDWGQTRYIAKHPDIYHEAWSKNVLTEHPSVGKVNAFFLTETVMIGVAAHYLPAPYRKLFLGGTIVMKLDAVGHNYGLGIKVQF